MSHSYDGNARCTAPLVTSPPSLSHTSRSHISPVPSSPMPISRGGHTPGVASSPVRCPAPRTQRDRPLPPPVPQYRAPQPLGKCPVRFRLQPHCEHSGPHAGGDHPRGVWRAQRWSTEGPMPCSRPQATKTRRAPHVHSAAHSSRLHRVGPPLQGRGGTSPPSSLALHPPPNPEALETKSARPNSACYHWRQGHDRQGGSPPLPDHPPQAKPESIRAQTPQEANYRRAEPHTAINPRELHHQESRTPRWQTTGDARTHQAWPSNPTSDTNPPSTTTPGDHNPCTPGTHDGNQPSEH